MKTTIFGYIFLLAFPSSPVFAQDEDIYSPLRYAYTEEEFCSASEKVANGTPRIEISYQIILSTPMSKALRKVEPDFKIWPLSHFDPYTRSTYKFNDEHSERLLRVYRSPSAVIGDFNGDGKSDVIMIGYDKTHEIEVTLLSKKNEYEVTVSSKTQYNKLPEDFDPHKPVCYTNHLELVEKGQEVKSGFEEKSLILKTDAFRHEGEKSSSIFYYVDGKWRGYVTGD